MNCPMPVFTLSMIVYLLANILMPKAEAAVLPGDGESFRIEIATGANSQWLGAKPTEGLISFTKVESSATRWRFHKSIGASYTIESLEDGKRWLTADPGQTLRLASSSSALASHWNLSVVGETILFENSASTESRRYLFFGSDGAQFVSRQDAEKSNLVFHGQKFDPMPFSHGDVISVRSMAAASGPLWLDGNTTSGQIGLADETAMLNNSGTQWRVHDNGDGSFSFECLGNVAGVRWLGVDRGTPLLASTNDRIEATHWKVVPGPLGTISLKNVSIKTQAFWLDSYPLMGTTSLAGVAKDSPGTSFQIRMRIKFDPSLQGRWSELESLPASGIHTHVLPDGKVLFWSRFMDPNDRESTVEGIVPGAPATFLYDPLTGLTKSIANPEVDAFCSGHAFLPDGRLLVSGGHVRSYVGTRTTQIFDFRSNTWQTNSAWDMNGGRWYPTNISLGNGDIITISGDATGETDLNRIPQVWSSTKNTWRDLTGLASSCFNATSGPCMPLYPWLHLSSSGRVFVSGPGQETGYIDTKGVGSWLPIANTNRGYRGDYEATSIMYAPGKILIAGGVPATNSVETIDLNAETPAWSVAAPMLNNRHKLMSTLLADGQVLVVGGSAVNGTADAPAVFATEIWNPATGQWREGDHMKIPRLYHATSVLLPDGRVLTQGGGLGAGYTAHKNMQIYSPPYLFKGPRPTFTSVNTVNYGQSLKLSTAQADEINKVHLIRLSSDTHSFNSTQHIVPLKFRQNEKSLIASMPTDGNLAPPGYYLLFIVDKTGVPSLGKTVKLAFSPAEAD